MPSACYTVHIDRTYRTTDLSRTDDQNRTEDENTYAPSSVKYEEVRHVHADLLADSPGPMQDNPMYTENIRQNVAYHTTLTSYGNEYEELPK